MHFNPKGLDDAQLTELYKAMLLPRMIEEKMLVLLRQGKISKWFSGIGQEAIAVGITLALEPDEYLLPMHRNLGVFTARKIPLRRLFSQWQGKAGGFSKGRERSFHFGTQEFSIVGMISHLGPQFGIADGIALGNLLKKNRKITAVFTGEGGTSEGDIHEAMNVASVWKLPVLFCVENNGYGLSTPVSEQYNCKDIVDRAVGYGMEAHIIDGNNILEVFTKVSALASEMRENPRPVLLEFKTFRMRGHEEASGTKYVPKDLMEAWATKDPIANYERYLLEEKILNKDQLAHFKAEIINLINAELEIAFEEKPVSSSDSKELDDVYQVFDYKHIDHNNKSEYIRFVDAVSQGLKQSMEMHDKLVLMGQDIAEYGGVFKVTEGFVNEFGKERVRNTPICESAILLAAYGLSVNGFKSVVEMQFSDFVSSGFNAVVNLIAKSYYRWSQHADIVVRMPCGAGVGAGPFHSQTNEAWFTKTPGLKVVYPAFPYDAKGLLATAINDPNPVMFFEHKALYRSIKQEVPVDYYTLPFGKASLLKTGTDISIISYGAAVHWALELLDEQPAISADLLDLRTLQPLDTEAIYTSVKKTGKALIVQEDTLFGGIASDISALIHENCFQFLDAPVQRVASLDTPVPFASGLEAHFLGKSRLAEAIRQLLAY
ncbi:MAG: dehydrogenase E1 component subunit alpha/beta [Flavobacteriaceae bacterium]|nr:dehydrogenase E1 component subunit alpha/beta [Flavobacteriaceae bacterium]